MAGFSIEIMQENDIQEMLDLQYENLVQNLDEATKASQGFVTFHYNTEIIKNMMELPQIIAKADGKLIGYALSASIQFSDSLELTKPMVELTRKLSFQGKPLTDFRYYLMGQVCVRYGYRGIGVFDALYEGHKKQFSNDYDYLITEVSPQNARSLAAHQRVGFKTIHTYFDPSNGKDWDVILWDWKK